MGKDNPFGSEVALQQWLDQEDAWMRDTVREYGWAVQAIFGAGCWGHPGCDCGQPVGVSPPFAYTVGLYGFGHPELVIFGLGIDPAHAVLNDLGNPRTRVIPGVPAGAGRCRNVPLNRAFADWRWQRMPLDATPCRVNGHPEGTPPMALRRVEAACPRGGLGL